MKYFKNEYKRAKKLGLTFKQFLFCEFFMFSIGLTTCIIYLNIFIQILEKI